MKLILHFYKIFANTNGITGLYQTLISDKPATTLVSNHPLLVYVGEAFTGLQLCEQLLKLKQRYNQLQANKAQVAEFSTFFNVSTLLWEDGEQSDVDLAKIKLESDENQTHPGLVRLWSVDGHNYLVRHAVASQLGIFRNDINKPSTTQRVVDYNLPGITRESLNLVVLHCNNQTRLYHNFSTEQTLQNCNLDILFNVIQASHHLGIPSLMDLSCQVLVKKVSSPQFPEWVKKFDNDTESVPKFNVMEINSSILRRRGRDVLINAGTILKGVQCSTFVVDTLGFVQRRKEVFEHLVMKLKNFELDARNKELEETIYALKSWLTHEPWLAKYLDADACMSLFEILRTDEFHYLVKDRVLYIVGLATSNVPVVQKGIPLLVMNLLPKFDKLRDRTLDTLTRLADDHDDAPSVYKEAIIGSNALEEVLKISDENHIPVSPILVSAAWFLVVVCRGSSLPPSKVEVARAIAQNILNTNLKKHIVLPCYALQYLSYDKSLKMEDVLLKKLVNYLWNDSSEVSGSALGVVGNIARLGEDKDIEIMVTQSKLLDALATIMLTFKWKKFKMEACQIISNIAARNETSRKVIANGKTIQAVCRLLEKEDDSDVKMEAAWGILNGIYGDRKRQIDKYSQKDDYENI